MGCVSSSAAGASAPGQGGSGMTTREPASRVGIGGPGAGGMGGMGVGGAVARLAGGSPTNRRIRPPQRWAAPEPISTLQLANKRSTFWETAPFGGGRRPVWDNLRMISDTLLQGDAELASALMQAADLRAPHFDLTVVYDSSGHLYEVPRFVFSNPDNLITQEEAAAAATAQMAATAHRGPALPLPVVLRLSGGRNHSEQDVRLTLSSSMKVSELKRTLHDALASGAHDQKVEGGMTKPNVWSGGGGADKGVGLPPARQRIMFRGKELKDMMHLQGCGIEDGDVVQVFVIGAA